MKLFAKWLLFTCLLYLSAGTGLHFYYSANPAKTFVLLDASFGMKSKWNMAKRKLDAIASGGSYREFALATGKSTVHSWSDTLDIGTTLTYGPRKITRYLTSSNAEEITEADRRIVITNDPVVARQFEDQGWESIQL